MHIKAMSCLSLTLLLQACAGYTAHYHSLVETQQKEAAIYLSQHETKKVLSIRNGFPGWWGLYPALISLAPDIASVQCQDTFIGETCHLTAHQPGETWLIYGNKFYLDRSDTEPASDKIRLIVR